MNGREVDPTFPRKTSKISSLTAMTASAHGARNLVHPSAATSAAASACFIFSAHVGCGVHSSTPSLAEAPRESCVHAMLMRILQVSKIKGNSRSFLNESAAQEQSRAVWLLLLSSMSG